MDETIQKEFETQWKRFLDKLKGRLLEEAQRKNLSYPMAKLILNETALCWENDHNGTDKGHLFHRTRGDRF